MWLPFHQGHEQIFSTDNGLVRVEVQDDMAFSINVAQHLLFDGLVELLEHLWQIMFRLRHLEFKHVQSDATVACSREDREENV